MDILNVMLAKGMGGIEQAFLDYSDALAHAGYRVHCVTHPRAAVNAALERRGIMPATLPNWGEWDPMAIWQLRGHLRKVAPFACVAHGNRALRLLRRAGAPRLFGVMHNYKIRCREADFVIGPTRDLLRHAAEQGTPGARLAYVPNMVRLPDEPPRRRKWPAIPVIGGLGRLVPKKGFEVMLAALAILRERGIEFRAIIGGEGEELENLKAQAAREGTAYEVRFEGWVTDKQAFFDAIDIFCLPSHHEPFGIVLLEAMAQALPIVSTKSEGPSEIISEGENGFLCEIGQPTALADALEAMLADPWRAQMLARNGFDTAQKRYGLPVAAQKLDLALRMARSL